MAVLCCAAELVALFVDYCCVSLCFILGLAYLPVLLSFLRYCFRPEKIEIVYSKSQYINQIFVFGDSLQSALVAVVVPHQEVRCYYVLCCAVRICAGVVSVVFVI